MMLSTLLAVSSASAKISLNPLFQKGAVLQREMSVPVWGNASPGALVEVSCAGKSAFARASSVGSFIARLPELPAGGPYKLTVIDHDNSEKISVDDILVGEVFLASGQSNMEYMLNADWRNNISPDGGESLARKQEREFFQQKEYPSSP